MSEPTTAARPAEPVRSAPRSLGLRADLVTVAVAAGLFAVAAVAGVYYNAHPETGVVLFVHAPPLFADWLPHVGPGTPFALVLAAMVVLRGPEVAARLRWRAVLLAGYAAALAWIFALAMVDGWDRGFARRVATDQEYLHEVPGITDIPRFLREFSARILDHQPDSWTTHVSGHPPGATLMFVWLDRLGLHGGAWAAALVIVLAALVAVAVPATVALLGNPGAARRILPFAVLSPGAVWLGVSADGIFAGVTASGIALLALSAAGFRTGHGWTWFAGLAAGVLLGFGIYLSYGLVLLGVVALAVAVLGRSWRAVGVAVAGALAVVVAFTAAGFWWVDGYHLVVERYYEGIASLRPYSYWVWADLAAVAVACGPAVLVAARRTATAAFLPAPRRELLRDPVLLITLAAVLTIAVADVSGLSKAEVERIWLPFVVWVLPATALLPAPGRRGWLAAQAATALAVNHLLLTGW